MTADSAYAIVLLSHPNNAGRSYVITPLALAEEFGGKFENVPAPDCEHSVFYHAATGCYVIERPKPDGSYVSDKERSYLMQGKLHKVKPLQKVR